MNTSEAACVYAALILQDDNVEITADKITALVEAANVEIEPIWATLFAKALEGKNVGDFLMNVGTAAPAAAAPAAAGGAAPAEKKQEAKKEEPKVEEESDEDMGFGLFD